MGNKLKVEKFIWRREYQEYQTRGLYEILREEQYCEDEI